MGYRAAAIRTALLLSIVASPAVGQPVPTDAIEAVVEHIHGNEGAVVIVVDRTSAGRALGLDLDRLVSLLGRLHGRGIPARWCQGSCPIAEDERRVSFGPVALASPDKLQLEVAVSGRRVVAPGEGGFTGWVTRHAMRVQRTAGRWSVVADRLLGTEDLTAP